MTKNHQKRVLHAMQQRIGLHTTAMSLADELPDLDGTQVGQALWSLADKGLVTKVAHGTYVYRGANEKDDGMLYEPVGQLGDGTTVVRSESGQLHALIALEHYYQRGGRDGS